MRKAAAMNTLAGEIKRFRLRASVGHISFPMLLWCLPALLAGAYITFTPYVDPALLVGVYDRKRLLEIGLLLVGAFCAAGVPRLRAGWMAAFRALPVAARWGLGAVLALGVASALTAPVPRYGLLEVAHLALLFSFGLALASLCRAFPKRYVQGLLLAVCASTLLYAVFFVMGYINHVTGAGAALWPGGQIGYGNQRFFNHVQAWGLPLLVMPALLPSLRRIKGLQAGILMLAACWWMLLFASGGRGIIMSMVVSLIGVAFLFRKKAWPWIRLHLATGTGGALLYGLLFQIAVPTATTSIAERAGEPKSVSGRLMNWQAAAEATVQEPWLGLGPMHAAYYPNKLWPTTHNAVVQFFAEWGIPAAVLLVGIALWGLRAWCQQSRQRVESLAQDEGVWLRTARIALTGSLLAAAANAMVSGVIVMPPSQVMMVLVLGGVLGMYLPRHIPEVSPSIPKGQWALVMFLMAGAGILVWAVSPDVFNPNARLTDWLFMVEEAQLVPRYWGQGIFGF